MIQLVFVQECYARASSDSSSHHNLLFLLLLVGESMQASLYLILAFFHWMILGDMPVNSGPQRFQQSEFWIGLSCIHFSWGPESVIILLAVELEMLFCEDDEWEEGVVVEIRWFNWEWLDT